MLFNSFQFAAFFAIVFPLYWVLAHRWQNLLLLIASYYFYACWDIRFLALLIISTVVDYALALAVDAETQPWRRKVLLSFSLAVNLGFLGFFKYFNFFADGAGQLLNNLGIPFHRPILDVVLPVGISFYTFQSMSYVIDVYRREIQPTRNLIRFAAFVSFFPHLVAGPIMRPTTLLPQIDKPRSFDWTAFHEGCRLVSWGLVKKCVIADNLAIIVDDHSSRNPDALTSGEILLTGYAFAFQIYCDFSGYTDIARGISKTMGFELALNFNLPFLSANPKELWSRWHMSLSLWLRDYLFIPLGGSRHGLLATCRNLIITMTLCGLWHGASWNCVLWGFYCGVWLSAHRCLEPLLKRLKPTQPLGSLTWHILSIIGTFHLFVLGVVLFRSPSLGYFGTLMHTFATNLGFAPWPLTALIGIYTLPLLCIQIAEAIHKDLNWFGSLPWPVRSLGYTLGFYSMVLLGEYGGNQFYYFQF